MSTLFVSLYFKVGDFSTEWHLKTNLEATLIFSIYSPILIVEMKNEIEYKSSHTHLVLCIPSQNLLVAEDRVSLLSDFERSVCGQKKVNWKMKI